jgi:hypothetical protein
MLAKSGSKYLGMAPRTVVVVVVEEVEASVM